LQFIGAYPNKIELAGFKDVTKIVALPDKPSVIALIDVEKERTIVVFDTLQFTN
jgi:hypothetical protein